MTAHAPAENLAQKIKSAEHSNLWDLKSAFDLVGERQRLVRRQKLCLAISSMCVLVALTAAVLNVFAGLAIQYCHEEDLMFIYWGAWSVVDIGSVFGILGTVIYHWQCVRSRNHPPWHIALGSPVLCFCSLSQIIKDKLLKALGNRKRKEELVLPTAEQGSSSTLISTLKIPELKVIISFPLYAEIPPLPPGSMILGTGIIQILNSGPLFVNSVDV